MPGAAEDRLPDVGHQDACMGESQEWGERQERAAQHGPESQEVGHGHNGGLPLCRLMG